MYDFNPTTGLPMSSGGIMQLERLMVVVLMVLMMEQVNQAMMVPIILLTTGAGKLMLY